MNRVRLPLLLAPLLALGCGEAPPAEEDEVEVVLDGNKLAGGAGEGKEDGSGRPGMYVQTDTRATQVWTASNRWEDRETPAARLAGIAWPADSRLSWDEKFAAWVESLPRARGHFGTYDTFTLTTPWGKTVPAPQLECAEVAIFLRATFSSWYNLPFFLEGTDGKGKRLFVGHFGMRTAAGNAGPAFGKAFPDHSGRPLADVQASWPRDEKLRAKQLYGGEDLQPALGENLHFGAYADEIFLNKRAGHFLVLLLDLFGSINLVDSSNTYNITPESIRAGDTLVERWQRQGIGHALPLKHVARNSAGKLVAELSSGSMPRRQPKWDDEQTSKQTFTSPYTGGKGTNYDGEEYVKLGGGIKRWRVTKNVGGYWTNTFMDADKDKWIRSDLWERLSARPEQFDALLGDVPPAEKRDGLLRQITEARQALKEHPASCSSRERREAAFLALYSVNQRYFQLTRAQTDRKYRVLDDYVFGELVYSRAKTCCWNSTTPEMYQVVMDYNRSLAKTMCVAPVVFKARAGDYAEFRAYAEQTGRAGQWKAWSEDEPCPQRAVAEDTEAPLQAAPWCSWSH